jgi:Damage-control phosphatase ARMT1-like domain
MTVRHPALLDEVRAAYPYGPAERAGIDRLRTEIDGVVEPLPGWDSPYFGRPWLDAPFLWAESCFYHKLLRAVGYPEPGPWQGVDPFGFLKEPELASSTVDDDLAQLARLGELTGAERTGVLLHAALWGNRADLGFRIGLAAAGGTAPDGTRLVADDSAALLTVLAPDAGRRIAVLADNAGRELLADLVLIDHLLGTGAAATVVLHVKPHPYYVSDATTADLVAALRRLAAGPPAAAGIAQRLRDNRFVVGTHPFWGGPGAFHALPDDLRKELSSFDLIISKGDLNYRRLVGDCHWAATTPFADLVRYLPTAVAALRTLKCEVAAGIDADRLAELEASGEQWRTSGGYGLIQLAAQQPPTHISAPPRG